MCFCFKCKQHIHLPPLFICWVRDVILFLTTNTSFKPFFAKTKIYIFLIHVYKENKSPNSSKLWMKRRTTGRSQRSLVTVFFIDFEGIKLISELKRAKERSQMLPSAWSPTHLLAIMSRSFLKTMFFWPTHTFNPFLSFLYGRSFHLFHLYFHPVLRLTHLSPSSFFRSS